ncbi:ATP-binding protein [Frankia sp. Mgl5]|uniref:ATP-binding protein n=1 Tax=Frankia sp. Mgl5 TaxID=2933793 RepID=UPI00200C15BA|nr:ATP-binding protein [Frankia sp. Mgl5]MCK9929201.1 ATP-binding protein [Frankia sp. Mgl5]
MTRWTGSEGGRDRSGAAGGDVGPNEAGLGVRMSRTLGLLRLVAVLFGIAVLLADAGWYGSPARLALPAVAACWGVVFGVLCLTRGLGRDLAAGELLMGLVVAGCAPWAVPPGELATGPNWVLLRLIGTGLTIVWCFPPAVWLPAVLAFVTLYTAVVHEIAAPSALEAALPAGAVIAVPLAFAAVIGRMRRGARRCDEWLALAHTRRRGRGIVTARRQDVAESDRLVHDTVLNTLTGIAWGARDAGGKSVHARCRQSVAICEDLLTGGRDWEDGLMVALGRALDQARATGLGVEFSFTGSTDTPAEVAAAVAMAVSEALSNVRRHSGLPRARVEARTDPTGVLVTVTDHGVGFTPGRYRADQLGLRRSIIDAMGDVGGSATVRSTPGGPTIVTLQWSRRSPDAPAVEVAELEERLARDTARAAGRGAVVWQLALGIVLVMRLSYYQHPGLVALAWAASGAALVCAGRASRRGPLRGPAVAGLTGLFLVTQIAAGALGQEGSRVPLNWVLVSGLGVCAFLTAACPVRQWLPASAAIAACAGGIVATGYSGGPGIVGYLSVVFYTQAVVQSVVGALGPMRRGTAAAAAEIARADAELAADLVASAKITQDRRARLDRLRADTLPLLAAIGDGRLDPAADEVRARCASSAAELRRAMTSPVAGSDLLEGLEPALRAAERRGVAVRMQVAGTFDAVPGTARDEVVAALSAVLATVTPAATAVTVTLTGTDDTGEAFVTADDPAVAEAGPPVTPAPSAWTQVIDDSGDGQLCVEIRWCPPQRVGGA